MFENFDVWTVVTLVLGAAATFFGTYLVVVKGKLSEFTALVKEFNDLSSVFSKALEDNNISDEEKDAIKKEWLDTKAAVAAFLKFKKA